MLASESGKREREIYRAALNVAVLGNKAATVDEDGEEEDLVTIEMACQLFQAQLHKRRIMLDNGYYS